MPTQITSREVLNCLNYLGYNNINAMQLKEFVKDLKKLMKHEERKKLGSISQNEQCEKLAGDLDYKPLQKERKKVQDTEDRDMLEERSSPNPADVFKALYAQGTFSSRAKIVPKKESVISVQIIKKSKCQHNSVHQNKENILCSMESKDKFQDAASHESESFVKPLQGHNSKSTTVVKKKPSNIIRTKSSFIRKPIPVNTKSDPVALYHQYKAGWVRQKIPGESQRAELRWAVREKMLTGAQVS